jgi:flagellar biosynthesis GTPase FlhF
MKDYLQLSTGLSYGEGSKIVDDFLNEHDFTVEGRLLDMENDDDRALILSNVQNPKTMFGKAIRAYKNDRAIEKARASREAIAAFEEENGWEPGTIRELAEADPMQLSDEELQMADQAREFLKGLAYPAGEVHVEHEQQEGTEAAKAVVENVISTEEPIDPNNNAGQQIFDANRAAEDAMTKLFDKNEDLKEEFNRLQGMGLSPQEIISSLDSFRPEDVQVVIDYFNANARYMSFMEEAAYDIDSVAH